MSEETELVIDSFCPRGYGVGKFKRPSPLPPLSVETAHVIPGDVVRVEMRKKMRGVRKGRLLEVLQSSSDRVSPRCVHATVCGGCSWQQMAYPAQLKEKQRRVESLFPGDFVSPIVGAEQIFGYRNKMEFTFSENRGGEKYLGLMIAQAEPYVFNLEECHLASRWFSETVQKVRGWWQESNLKAYHPFRNEGTLRYLTLREGKRTDEKMVILNVSGDPEWAISRAELDRFAVLFSTESVFLRIHQTKKGTPTQFFEMHLKGADHIFEELHLTQGKFSFKISPSSFFQPNTLQAEVLYNTALGFLSQEKIDTLYDLYCGTGTLGMAASRFARQVIGVELSSEALLDAEENRKRNQLENVRFYQGDVGKVLTRHPEMPLPDAVIVDPPRAGLDPLAMSHLQRLKPRFLLYISCNPLTQAENVKQFLRSGYQIQVIQPVDQFPHTYHIENILLLKRID